nr:hypothetical protein [Tanacetum cinerariifolium]
MLLMQAQENGTDDCDAFDSNVDEAPTAQTMFMANLSFADHVNEVSVVHSNVSSVPNDAFMMIYNDMCEPHAQSVSNPSRNTVVKNSLTAELATYKEQVELYERRAKFELTEREQKINEQEEINNKMKDPECVTRKVKIAPHDYPKDNFFATFTTQKQLTPEQIFWSHCLIKLKSEALKEKTTVSRPIKALTVGLHQLGSLGGERGFEQAEEYYLKEVIPFFKTLKDSFEGIQKALTKEIKEMKDVFEELEAKVAQSVVDRKHDAIERKTLFIANDNLIVECLSKEVFSVATNSELNVARLTEMTVAHTTVEARCLELEAELANLCNTSHHDNQEELNLTKPRWDAMSFEYKHDYTVIDSPRAVMFRDRYGVQMMMRFNEIHKFSDGTLQQIDEALDCWVKEFRIHRINPGLNMRFWTRKDVDRSKAFMLAIPKRLKTRRIFCNLESYVGGCVREGDYRLLKRT